VNTAEARQIAGRPRKAMRTAVRSRDHGRERARASALSRTYDRFMTLTRFGFHFSSISYADVDESGLFPRIAETAMAAESAGFDSLWVPDHVHQNRIGGGPSGPMLEAYTLLAALATKTERVLLGSLVTPVTFRHPALLAKVVTTLDVNLGRSSGSRNRRRMGHRGARGLRDRFPSYGRTRRSPRRGGRHLSGALQRAPRFE